MVSLSLKVQTRALLFILGIAASFGQAPFSLWPISIGALVGFFFLQFKAAEGELGPFQHGWIFGFGYFVGAINWILEPFLIDASSHAWMAPFALALMAGGLAVFWGVGAKLGQLLGDKTYSLAFGLGIAELVRGYILTGFPWALAGYVWMDTPVAQLASLVGVYGLTNLTFVLAAIFVEIYVRRGIFSATALGCVLILASWSWGTYRITDLQALETSKVIRLVQPNAPQQEKWHPEHSLKFFALMLEYSAAEPKPDIIIWPETALPIPVEYASELLDQIRVATKNSAILFGALRFDGEQYFNSIIYLDQNEVAVPVYDKHHLVPFGEYLPFESYLGGWGVEFVSQLFGLGFGVGPGPSLFMTEELGAVLPLICYEAVFPQDARVSGARADVLVQITNDAWFGTNSGPQQHLKKAQMRSIEQGLTLIRVANTGISGVVDPYGRLIDSIALNQAGFLDAQMPPMIQAPFYARIGDWASIILLCFLLGMSFWKRTETLRVDLKTK
jgi:apolipoprotein N-acyltransferase